MRHICVELFEFPPSSEHASEFVLLFLKSRRAWNHTTGRSLAQAIWEFWLIRRPAGLAATLGAFDSSPLRFFLAEWGCATVASIFGRGMGNRGGALRGPDFRVGLEPTRHCDG